jgi:hypothetical protein
LNPDGDPAMHPTQRFRPSSLAAAALMATVFGAAGSLAAQSASVGGLVATIVDERGVAMRDVTVTVERGGFQVKVTHSDRLGLVRLGLLTPGAYSVLAEELEYQPVRMRGISVVGGGITHVTLRLSRRPPPITSVEEQPSDATIAGTQTGEIVSAQELWMFNRRTDATGAAAMFSDADVPLDGHDGFTSSGNGLLPRYGTLIVDGIREPLLQHPGIPSEPGRAPLFTRDGTSLGTFTTLGLDGDWRTALGASLATETGRGGDHFRVRGWTDVGGSQLPTNANDYASDSSAIAIRAGLRLGGPIKGDTAGWFLSGNFARVQEPGAAPFHAGIAGVDSTDLYGAIVSAAQTRRGIVATDLAPTVRTWQGGSGTGRFDWRFGSATTLSIRAGAGNWSARNPEVGNELTSGEGSEVDARDASGAVLLTTGSTALTSETRIGLHSSRREWNGSSLAYTGLVGDGIAFGGGFTLPGTFSDNGLGGYETVTLQAGVNTLKGGLSVEHNTTNYNWLPGSSGRYLFGDLASFQAQQGSFYQAIRAAVAPDIGLTYAGAFLEDVWQPTPQIQLMAGLRYERESIPAGLIALDVAYASTSNLRNDLEPTDRKADDLGPRGGVVWDVSGDGRTMVRASVALDPGRYDVAALAEAAQYDGDIQIRRAVGTLAWPTLGGSVGDNAGQALTFFSYNVRKPREYKSDISLAQRLGTRTTVTVRGGYRHTDYLLRRDDVNRVGFAVSTSSDGRPVYGSLQQFGGLVTPTVGSNRRFSDFDMVYGLTSTGYTDYYEANLAIEHQLGHGFGAGIYYTYSRTTDNLVGQLSADPADQLSPFPDGVNGVRWEDGRSDLDLPHRVAATLSWTAASDHPVVLAVRYRYRSGLPFTPGFRSGVDANGDGSGNNDPAFLGSTISGMTALASGFSCLGSQANLIASRNSCRDAAAQSLDLNAAIPLPLGNRGVTLTVDGYNLLGTTTGIFDHAAVLVDAHGTITTDGAGHFTLPLIANPGFGQLLSQRGIPRQVRVGIRVEN